MSELASRDCIPCRRVPPLPAGHAELVAQLDGWEVVNQHHLRKGTSLRLQRVQAFVNSG